MKKIKQTVSLFLSIVMIASTVYCTGVTGFATESDILDYLTYEINNGEVIITDCDSSISGEVVIPDTIEGYPVTAIGSYAFSWCKEITKVKIPSGVKVLQNDAFLGCSALYDIILPENPINMGSSVFENTAYYNDEANWSNGLLYLDYYLLAANTSECIVKPGTRIIAKDAFSYNYLIKSIEIPASVEYIYDTFCYSENLNHISVDSANANYTTEQGVLFNKDKTVLIKYPPANVNTVYTIPDSVITISDSAFLSAAYLENIIIPDGVVTIEKNVFEASNIKSISISASVETIGESSFLSCHELEKITIDENNAYYSSDENGVLFNKNKTVLIQYPLGNKISEYSIPDTVKTIGYGSFSHCKCLETVIIPDSVTEIEAMAFSMYDSGSYMLKNIVMGKNVAIIGAEAFSFNFKIEKIELSESVTTIESGALSYCRNLKNVSIPESIAIIENGVFNGCENLTDVYYAGSEALWNTIYIGNSLNDPLYEATIHYSDDETDTEIINYFTYEIFDGEVIITGCDRSISGDIVIPDTIEGYPVTAIGEEAFSYCNNIVNITIPDGLIQIGNAAFFSCNNLEFVSIPDSVTHIGDTAFSFCESLKSVTISKNVISIGYYAFHDCRSLENITVDENNQYYSSDDYGVFFDKNKTILYQYPLGNSRTSYTVPDGVLTIDDAAFSNNKTLESVIISDSVTAIHFMAFDGCISLESIIIPDGVQILDTYAFRNCSSLTKVIIPASVSNIGYDVFVDCNSLIEIRVHEDNKYYYSDNNGVLYYGNSRLLKYPPKSDITNYVVPEGITTIERYAFENCTSLVSIKLPESLNSIGFVAFYGCYSLESIDIPYGVSEIDESTFEACSKLKDVIIPDSVTTIGPAAFLGCNELKNINIPDSVTNIADNAFAHCTKLENITIPNNLKSIDQYTFNKCAGLETVIIPTSISSIQHGAFNECTSLTDVYFLGTREQWNEIEIKQYNENLLNANIHCSDDEEKPNIFDCFTYEIIKEEVKIIDCYESISGGIVVPDTIEGYPVTVIGNGAFSNCISLADIVLPDTVKTIENDAFGGCTSLKKVVASGVESIGENAFADCDILDTVLTFAESLEIADTAFDANENLTVFVKNTAEITAPDTLDVINFSLTDDVLSFSGEYKSDLYYLFDLVAMMCTYYDDVQYLFFDSFEAISADEGNIYYYTDNWERIEFDGTKITNVKFSVEAFDGEEFRKYSFNELCEAVGNGEIENFNLVVEEADGLDRGNVEISLVDQISMSFQRILKALTNLINKLFSFFKKLGA